jgi:tRNA (guanine-N7-)-methyltransferase
MPKNKLERFAEVGKFSNCVYMSFAEAQEERFPLKGKWKVHFKNDHPIVLELGCGKGEYTVGLAQKYRGTNFIGVDIKGNRIWVGARSALEKKLDNVAFLRTRIDQVDAAFSKDEVSAIWITFPDPQPTQKREKKRLTSPRFLERYKKFLKPGGIIHLKTDSELLYDYTLELVQKNKYTLLDHTNDLYASADDEKRMDVKSIKTYYEERFLREGKKITYLCFRFSDHN